MSAWRTAAVAGVVLLLGSMMLASPRPDLTSGACLSCHGRDVATLPAQPCIACHSGNMAFLQEHQGGDGGALWLIGAAGGGGLAVAALLLIVGTRRLLPAAACLSIVIFAATPGAPPAPQAPMGASFVAEGLASDLSPCLSPDGSALLFARRGPDTDGDGTTNLRDGLALFLLHRGATAPKRVTPYALDAQAAMASWSPDGSRFALPLPAIGQRPAGLGLYDARGRGVAFLPSEGGEILAPVFALDGDRIAFVEGTGIGLWDLATGNRTWALAPLSDGQFPRLYGWSLQENAPLFTRGFDYARLERDRDGARILPAEVPLECARSGSAVVLTPRGPSPLRRFKAQPSTLGTFYLAQAPHGTPGLYLLRGATETRWSPEGVAISGYLASGDGACWAWMAEAEHRSRLVRFDGPGRWRSEPVAVQASLAALASAGGGLAWASGEGIPGEARRLYRNDRPSALRGWMNVYGLSAAGDALALVRAEPREGNPAAEPWDRARLWVMWEAP